MDKKETFKEKLVISFTYKGKVYKGLIDYGRDVEIDEGVQWHADGICAGPGGKPYVSVYGLLDKENKPRVDDLIVYAGEDEGGETSVRIDDVKVLDIDGGSTAGGKREARLEVTEWGELALLDELLDNFMTAHGRRHHFYDRARSLKRRVTPVLIEATRNL